MIEQCAARQLAPLQVSGQHWHSAPENDRMVFQDENGLLDLPRPNLPGDHQIQNAGTALSVLRALECPVAAFEAAVTQAEWPARMQRLTQGAFSAPGIEVWLDGGHNPAAGAAIADLIRRLPKRPTHLICGMLNTKDPVSYLSHLSDIATSVTGVSIPDATATLTAEETVNAAKSAGLPAQTAPDVQTAFDQIVKSHPGARVLICGSLYLAGHVLRQIAG